MKISYKSPVVTFASINYGECFVADGDVYIKTQMQGDNDSYLFGCGLDDGTLRCFKISDYVHPINMEAIEI